jgi:phosphoribosyl-ATP pyrophosphohydrolase/phosphoribosyl-AMP cyclohydrolase
VSGEKLPLAGLAEAVDWEKLGGLAPAIVQDDFDGRVLMLGYMNREALELTLATGRVTFWSRSREQLWCKGETSGHFLDLVGAELDCDADCLLVRARPAGPTCHLGTDTCFDRHGKLRPELAFLATLERVIAQRDVERPEGSYTTSLLESGVKRIAQKVGEEGVETALAAAAGEASEVLDESADLLYHLLVLLRSRELTLRDLVQRLEARHG